MKAQAPPPVTHPTARSHIIIIDKSIGYGGGLWNLSCKRETSDPLTKPCNTYSFTTFNAKNYSSDPLKDAVIKETNVIDKATNQDFILKDVSV